MSNKNIKIFFFVLLAEFNPGMHGPDRDFNQLEHEWGEFPAGTGTGVNNDHGVNYAVPGSDPERAQNEFPFDQLLRRKLGLNDPD